MLYRTRIERLSVYVINLLLLYIEVSLWWGGFWEPMVQVVKRSLQKILSKSKLTYEELLTVICEIESVVNWRPLCYVYNDSIEEVITPSHILIGRRVLRKLDSDFNENNMDCDALSRWYIICKYWLFVIGTDGNEDICPSCVNVINL